MREGHNGYCPSPGITPAREAIAAEYNGRGWPVSPDRVLVTAGTSEAIDLALSALLDEHGEVLVPMPTYPLYTAVVAKLGARAVFYRTDPSAGWLPDLDHLARVLTPATRAIVVIDPNNPTGATYPVATRKALLSFADKHGLAILADEVYGDIAYEGSVAPLGSLDVAALKKLADGRLCSTVPMQFGIKAALEGDRAHQAAFRAALRERAAVTTRALQKMPGVSLVAPTAAFYAMPKVELPPGKTDEDYVLGLLRATGILCVHGSGFGTSPADGYLRIVFLAAPKELQDIYAEMSVFTAQFLQR